MGGVNEEKAMRKILAIILVLLLILCMVVPAMAATPALKVPSMPKIPTIKVELKLSENFWADYFAKNPIKIGPLYLQ